METESRVYVAIDLKSFYASVECVERGLDPLTTNLVVADESRTEKTICLAVSPSLKAYGISGRARLFEVVQRVREVNASRRSRLSGHTFSGCSSDARQLEANPTLEVGYVIAQPRMAFYMDYSTRIYQIYLRYFAPEDMHVYSIDEVFLDVTAYRDTYHMTGRELAVKLMQEIYEETGITATAGVGTNLYLCKIAMDLVAKHMEPDQNGARLAELDEQSYRRLLWTHEPLTDFWRVGHGYARKLQEQGLNTMGDIARCSLGTERDYYNEELLYRMFGVNAELLIDHAWGYEPCTMEQIKAYQPENNSRGSGMVLPCPHTFAQARLIVKEMVDLLALELVDRRLLTDQLVLTVGYDRENLSRPDIRVAYRGQVTKDRYGRAIPKHAHGTEHLSRRTSSGTLLTEAALRLYDRIVEPQLLIRRIDVTAIDVRQEPQTGETRPGSRTDWWEVGQGAEGIGMTGKGQGTEGSCVERSGQATGGDLAGEGGIGQYEQLSLFVDYEEEERKRKREEEALEREKKLQQAMLSIKKKYGKNAVLKAANLQEGSRMKERNEQIGGHKA